MKAAASPKPAKTRQAPARKAPAVKAPAPAAKTATPEQPATKTARTVSKKGPSTKPVQAKVSDAVVRDSFTMTSADHELLKMCKRDAVAAGRDSTKKSEIVRAALKHFAQLSAAARLVELNNLWPIKTGRPNKKK